MRVRPATIDDRRFILELAPRFAEFEMPPWRSRADVVEGTARRLEEALDAAGARSAFVVAEDDDGTPLGFAWLLVVEDFYSGRDVAKISEIAVARDGSGAGAALMEAAERFARERGCSLVVLNVMEHNAHARAFYARHGFAPEYTLMAKKLSP